MQGCRAYTREFDTVLRAETVARGLPPGSGPAMAGEGDLADLAALASTLRPGAPTVILLDQSGSSARGAPGTMVAVDMLAHALEASCTPFEVLGFTTTHGKLNPAVRKWVANGRPENPGRLTPLLHVVFKAFDDRWAAGRRGEPSPRECLSRMSVPAYMRDNVDGEAIDWASARLRAGRVGGGRVLVVSDADPVDEATMTAEGNEFLRMDLDRAVAQAARDGVSVTALWTGSEAAAAARYPSRVRLVGRPPLPAVSDALDALGMRRSTATDPEARTAERFADLVERWKRETALHSSVTKIRANDAFRGIVSMGEEALPHVVESLRAEPGHLVMAMTEITGAHPYREEDRGRLPAMARAWVEWWDAGRSESPGP